MLITDCFFVNKALHHPPEMKSSREAKEKEEYSDNFFAVECGTH